MDFCAAAKLFDDGYTLLAEDARSADIVGEYASEIRRVYSELNSPKTAVMMLLQHP